ncbi:MAG: hypothetical protein Aurels2KO_10390 [Aureliella sp.]
MTQVVALASLAGIGIDIVAGDVVGCTGDEATRLVGRNLARPFDAKLDSGRRVKSLHPETETKRPNPGTKRTNPETNAANSEAIVIDLSQFPTAILVDADTGVTEENVDAMVAAELVNLDQVSKATTSALKKLDTIGAATVKKIRAGIEAIRQAAVDAADDEADAEPNTNTDEDDGEADESTADQAGGAEGQEA